MGFLNSLFGGENAFLTILIALAIVLILIILGVWALKLVFNASGRASRGRAKRLSVVDVSPIDQKRRLVLVRRDNTEHLLLIGGGQDVVVEAGITTEPLSTRLARLTPSAKQPAAAQAAAPSFSQPEVPASSTDDTRPVTPAKASTRVKSTNLPPDLVATRTGAPSHTSLRHTALMRPNERREPDVFPNSLQHPSSGPDDSDKKSGEDPAPAKSGKGSSKPDNRGEPHLGRDGDEAHTKEAQKDN